ncbi:hypothetical protein SAMN05192566_1414 [Methylophilus rhizosphaerae]|uniref:Uncharacterized protein n=1 Tax=Methylophilus rhizosphaerae TaxID=492660 RepID=A0A1G9CED2_9PROT|nr:hypothetical protein SAMN05192566_1414 [Methylophilus rhizosphaerae]
MGPSQICRVWVLRECCEDHSAIKQSWLLAEPARTSLRLESGRLARRLQRGKSDFCRLYCLRNIRIAVGGGDKACFKGRWPQINTTIQHAVEEGIES